MRARRIATSGSTRWPTKPGWRETITDALDDQLARCQPGDTLIVRHGAADQGVDRIVAGWIADHLEPAAQRTVRLVEETVPARWEECAPSCRPEHRRVNRGNRGKAPTYCPSAGHRRNPDIPAHPDYPVDLFLAWCLNDSSGTSKTIEHARKARIAHRTWNAYR
ncbi:hypothetical protein ACFFMN_23320 [Planobispora siamensis]|uniref:Uncharacterized protein n=1 Tax=Planobispora siamensis TaxID=936338 RepID=A0A8J3STF4_9ACTN|nr:hypothetical protein [Planobispora siamensis]GIH95293.1 hypothetical protein Psi01_59230 [Planobispora siamensis]